MSLTTFAAAIAIGAVLVIAGAVTAVVIFIIAVRAVETAGRYYYDGGGGPDYPDDDHPDPHPDPDPTGRSIPQPAAYTGRPATDTSRPDHEQAWDDALASLTGGSR